MTTNANFYKIVSQNKDLLVDLAQARQHLFIYDDTSSDELIELYLATAQELVEDWINQPITPTQVNAYFAQLDPSGLVVPHPFIYNAMLTYYDTSGVLQTVSPTYWTTDTTNDLPRIYAPTGSYFADSSGPQPVNTNITNPVLITYTAQLEEVYSATTRTSDRVRQAILMYLTDLWNNRADESDAKVSLTTIVTARRLLKKYRPATF